jgi:hypothetical protein
MIRLGALFWLMLVVATGFVTFKVKYAVQDIEDELNRVKKQTVAEQQEIRVLTAEWTYLNQPERLAELNRRFLQLAPVGTKQLQQKIDDIPYRPLPPPPPIPEPDIVVAAAPEPPAPPAPRLEPAPALSASPGAASALAALTISPAWAGELPVVPAAIKPAVGKAGIPVQLARAGAARQPRSLDDLFSQIAETR